MPSDLDAIETFANNALSGDSADSLIVPGLSVAVLATVMHVNDPCISSTMAVQLARQADLPGIVSEMDARTAGATSADEAIGAIHRHLAWARVPLGILSPFTTPLGPSTLWFYIGDGRVYDMTQGFDVRPGDEDSDEGRQAMISRLAEHVRTVRGRLLARFHNTNEYGSMVQGSTTAPIYRAIVDEYRHSADAGHTGLRDPSKAAQFIHRVMGRLVDRRGTSAGNLHMNSMERISTILLPSFLQALETFPASDAASCSEAESSRSLSPPHGPALALRITLELGNRPPGALAPPPSAVHVPLDIPEVERVLEMVAHEQAAGRARALLRHRAGAPVNAGGRTAHNSQQPPRSRLPGSHQLSWYLRHQASTRPDGFVAMETLLSDLNAPGLTAEHVLELVEMDPKGRFDVADEEGGLVVRANQGHTVLTVDADQLMTPIDDPENLPICLHGTYIEALEAIVRSGSLNRMQRCAIQMAAGLPSDPPQVRSGIRSNAEVLIYVDVRAAMALGLRFYRSSNGVICCPGPIPVSCFLQVVQMSNGSLMDIKSMQQRLDTGSICIDTLIHRDM